MTPYYQEAGIQIFHGDCREVLPTLPKVDLVLTDPPYGVGMRDFDDTLSTSIEGFNLCRGSLAAMFMSPAKLGIVLNSTRGWRFDRCLWMHKEADIAFPWRAWCMNSEAILLFSASAAKWPRMETYRSDVYRVGPWERAGHPNGKPLAVVSDLAGRMSRSGDLILDPFVGSGTTLRAAKDLNRRAIGIEIEERYCEIAAKRLAQSVMDFGPPSGFCPVPVAEKRDIAGSAGMREEDVNAL